MTIKTHFEVYDFDSLWAVSDDKQVAINIAHQRWNDTLIGKDDTSLSQYVKVVMIQEIGEKSFKSELTWYQHHAVV
jgi:hypothetical protein